MDDVTVIGGSGFLGSHVADELTQRGFQVTVYDRKPSPWIRDNQIMIVGDMLDENALKNACKRAKYLYHFGGISDIGEARDRPLDTIQTNVIGAAKVLEVACSIGVERIVYASTMYVYSSAGSFYRVSKQAAEAVIEAYAEHCDLSYTLLRYGSLYGPRAQAWNGLKRYVSQVVNESRLI